MSDHPAAKPRGGVLNWALWGAALAGVAAVVYIIAMASFKQPAPQQATETVADAAHSVAKKLEHPADGSPPPDYVLYDAAGKAMKLADLKGKVVVMNVWATWCGPCKLEMPTLAKLQAAYAGKPVEVVAVSIDTVDAAAQARLFIAQNDPLKFYHDREMKLPFELKPAAVGTPTTVIYGKDGRERGRVSGDADWAGGPAKAFIDKLVAES
jgi:thiol-disulfide isomerase/thioredoxin